jgi:hypothetical protein
VTGILLKQNVKQTSSKTEANGQAKSQNGLGTPLISDSDSKSSSPEEKNDGLPRGVAFPLGLNSEAFRAAWARWEKHRKEIKKPLKPTSAQALLERFAEWGEQRAIAAILYTLEKGWQGIREPGPETPPHQANGKPRPTIREEMEEILKRKEAEKNGR